MASRTLIILLLSYLCNAEKLSDPVVCAGYVHPMENVKVDMSGVQMGLFTNNGKLLTFTTQANPHNGYYFIPVYEPGTYEIRAVSPVGWSFEPESHTIEVQNADSCTESHNFRLTGFSIFGRTQTVSTLKDARDGLTAGPRDLRVLLRSNGGKQTVEVKTDENGEFTFDHVLPGEYTIQLAEDDSALSKTVGTITAKVTTTNADLRDRPLIIPGYSVIGGVVSANEPVADVDLFLYSTLAESELTSPRLAKAFAGCDRRVADDDEMRRHVETFAQNEVSQKGGAKPQSGVKWSRVCAVRSNAEGQFRVEAAPNGDYLLAARYRNAATSFGISPRVVRVSIRDAPVAIRQRFRIAGFALTGRILLDEKDPVAEASVTLTPVSVAADVDDKADSETAVKTTRTDATGAFRFDNVHSGEYRVGVVLASGAAEFDERRVTVSPTSAQLAPIRADRVRVCGRVELVKNSGFSAARSIRFQPVDPQKTALTVQSDEDGRFCLAVAPQIEYDVRVSVTPAERERGLSISPAVRRVSVRRPVLDAQQGDLVFRQFRAAIRGEIRCLAACGSKSVVAKYAGNMQRHGEAGNRKLEKAAEQTFTDRTERRISFEFTDLLPGAYVIELDARSARTWCWSHTEPITVTIGDAEAEAATTNAVFEQTGYRVALLSSHAYNLRYSLADSKNAEHVQVQKGAFAFCVQNAGTYQLVPESECMRFAISSDADGQQASNVATSSFSVSTDSLSGLITVNAVDYTVLARVELADPTHHAVIFGSTEPQSENDVKSAPALSLRYSSAKEDTEMKTVDMEARRLVFTDAKPATNATKKQRNVAAIEYVSYMPIDAASFEFEPRSGVILFDPPKLHFDTEQLLNAYANRTAADGCPSVFGSKAVDSLFLFRTNRGMIIEGRVEPAVADAEVRVRFDAEPESDAIVTRTDAAGAFRCGPVRSGLAYSLEVTKPGFELQIDEAATKRAADKHTYLLRAVRLVSISVRVLDAASGEPLRGVLASLSSESEAAFHAHKFTQADGRFVLDGLRPATYYLSAVLKEYEFEPASTRIDLRTVPAKKESEKTADGEPVVDYELTLRGKRVAYSVYGVVVSLNGDAEAGVLLEAVPHSSLLSVETCTSDADGAFRLSGLKSNQSYTVRVRDASAGGNTPVERVFPSRIDVQLVDSDAAHERFIVVRKPAFVELSVEVQLLEFLPDAVAVPINLGSASSSFGVTAGSGVTQHSYVPTNMALIPANLHLFVIREATHEIVARHAVRSSLIFYSRDAVPIDNQLYFVRLATTDSHAVANAGGDDELLMFRANGSSRHFALPYREQVVRTAGALGRFGTSSSRASTISQTQRAESGSGLLGSARMVLFAFVLIICAFVAIALIFGEKQATSARGNRHGREADAAGQKLTLRNAPIVIGNAVARYTLMPLKDWLADVIISLQTKRTSGYDANAKRRESPSRKEPTPTTAGNAPFGGDDSDLTRRNVKQQRAKRI